MNSVIKITAIYILCLTSKYSFASIESPFFSLTINSEDKTLKANDTLEVLIGDLMIVRTFQTAKSQDSFKIDLIGFDHKLAKPLRSKKKDMDDSMILVRTDQDLINRLAQGPDKNIYTLVATSQAETYKSFIRLIEPQLDRVEFSVNGKPIQVARGETLEIKKSDRFQITRIFTNVRNNENVVYKLHTSETPRINFKRGSTDLGQITIKWVD